MKVINTIPRIKLYYGILSSNPNITYELVESYINEEWDQFSLSENPAINWEDINSNLTHIQNGVGFI